MQQRTLFLLYSLFTAVDQEGICTVESPPPPAILFQESFYKDRNVDSK